MRRRVRWHDRRNGSSSDSALRLVRTSSARLRRNRWTGSSNESGTSREGPRRQHQDDNGRVGHVYAWLARLFRLLPNARGADRSHSLGPVATAGCPLAPMENTTASASGTHRAGSPGGATQHGRQRSWTLASRPEQSPLRGTLQCSLQIARSPIPVRRVLAQLLEPPCTDPYARWCGRGGAARLPPIPINAARTPAMLACMARGTASMKVVKKRC